MEDRVGLGAGTDVTVFSPFITTFIALALALAIAIAIAIAIAVAEYDRKVEPNKRHKRLSPTALRPTDSVAESTVIQANMGGRAMPSLSPLSMAIESRVRRGSCLLLTTG